MTPNAPLTCLELFEQIQAASIRRAIVVGSSPRAPDLLKRELSAGFNGNSTLIVGLNAAISLVEPALTECRSTTYGIWSLANDWRVASDLETILKPALTERLVRLWSTNIKGSNFIAARSALVPLRYLGDDGFSLKAEYGIYSGYTVAYTAMQVLLRTGVQEIALIGVDLSYRPASESRFYGPASARTDTHVLGLQVENMQHAVATVRKRGIAVTSPTPAPGWFPE